MANCHMHTSPSYEELAGGPSSYPISEMGSVTDDGGQGLKQVSMNVVNSVMPKKNKANGGEGVADNVEEDNAFST